MEETVETEGSRYPDKGLQLKSAAARAIENRGTLENPGKLGPSMRNNVIYQLPIFANACMSLHIGCNNDQRKCIGRRIGAR